MPDSENPVTCPTFIGRQPDRRRLEQLASQALGGQGQIALITGEAGIGKSRLAAEAKAYASGRALVLEGACFETSVTLPYGPLLELFGSYFARSAARPPSDLFGPFAADVAALFPHFRAEYPVAPAAPGPDQHWLPQAFAHALARLAHDQPLLILVEDLHWGDTASLEFLALFARRLPALPLLLVLTFRDDETTPALTHLLAELERARLGVEFKLPRLNLAEVEAMLRAIFQLKVPVRQDFLEALYALAEGNPFFIEETLKSLSAAGDIFYADGRWDRKEVGQLRIPHTVQDAIQRRTGQLSEGARRALTLAAVAGRRFEVPVLQAVLGLSEMELTRHLKDLIAAQLVVEHAPDQFMFRHALTREAIYAGLLGRERQAAHRTLGETLERLHAGSAAPPLAELSYHFAEGRAWDKAGLYSRLAGERAQRLFAPREALASFSRAIEAGRQLGSAPPPGLLRARGQAHEALGDFEAARNDFEAAMAAAGQLADQATECQCLVDLGALWVSRDYARAGDYFQRAAALAATQDAALHAESLNRLGNWWVNVGRPADGLDAHRQALAIFAQRRDVLGQANTHDLLGMASLHAGDLSLSYAEYQQAIGLYQALEDRRGLASALIGACHASYWDETDDWPPQSYRENRAVAGQALVLVRRLEALAAQAYVLWSSSIGRANQGDFSAALAEANESLSLAAGIEHRQWIAAAHYALGHVYLQMRVGAHAVAALRRALTLAHELGSAWWLGNISADLASAHLVQGDRPAAAQVLREAAALSEGPLTLIGRRLRLVQGALLLAQDQPAAALAIAEELRRTRHGPPDAPPIPALWLLQGQALAALRQPDLAAPALDAACVGAEARDARPLLWQAHAAQGWLYTRLRRKADAHAAFEQARRVVHDLAAGLDDPDLRQAFERSAQAMLPVDRPPTARRLAAERFDGLTSRERQVAHGLLEGKSNAEIAAALVLSERTVENHISHILTKLDLESRLQIAAWAVDKGLDDDDA